MAKWNEIESSPKYAALSDEQKASVKASYFDKVIAPQAPAEHRDALRSRFLGSATPSVTDSRKIDRSVATLGATQRSERFPSMARDDGAGTVSDPFRPSGLFQRSSDQVFDEAPTGAWVRMEDGSLKKRETTFGEAVANIPARMIGIGASAIEGVGDMVRDYTEARDTGFAAALRNAGRESDAKNFETQAKTQRETGLNTAIQGIAGQLHDASQDRSALRRQNVTIQDVFDDPLGKTLPFIGETSLHSAGDMAMAMNPATLPVLMGGLSNEIAETRMENDGRSGRPSGTDRAIGAVGGIAQSGLESFGMGRLLRPVSEGIENVAAPILRDGFVDVMKRVAKETGVQSGQEAIEEGIGYGTETVGTNAGSTAEGWRDSIVGGALAGGGMGFGVQAGKEAFHATFSGVDQPQPVPPPPPPLRPGEDLLNGGTVADQMANASTPPASQPSAPEVQPANPQAIQPSPVQGAAPISRDEVMSAAVNRGAELEAMEADGVLTQEDAGELAAIRQNINNVGMLAAMMGRTLEADQDVATGPATPAAAPDPVAPEVQPVESAVPQTGLTNAIQAASAPDSLVPSGSAAKPVDQDVTMQNRARDRAASVVQMQGIANNPDPARLSYSRDPGTGAPMVYIGGDASTDIADSDFGKPDTVTMANGRKVPVRYAVVEADQIQASHTVDGASNPDYLQPLPAGGVRALNNGRTAGLQSAFARGSAGGYVEGIIADGALHGVSAEAIRSKRKPVLVRVYPEAENTGDMGAESNASQALGLSASEQAATDARALPDMGTLSVGEDGDLLAAGNRPFIRSWLQAMGQNEASRMLSADGEPTKQMVDRLKAAIFHRAYGADRLTSAMAEDARPEMRNILAALTMAAPRFATIDRAGAFGDVAAQIADAIELIRDSKARGIAIGSVRDMFSERASAVDELAKRINDKARAPRKLGELMNELARFAKSEQDAAQTVDIFGRAPLTYDDAIKAWDQFDEQQNPDAARARAKSAEPETAPGAVQSGLPVGDSGPNRSEVGREGQPAEQAKEPGLIPALMLSAQQAPVVEAPRAAAAQTSLFAPPTRAEVIKGAERKKDAERNGENSTGRTDMMAGDGELFAGPRPVQVDIESAAQDAVQQDEAKAREGERRSTDYRLPSAEESSWNGGMRDDFVPDVRQSSVMDSVGRALDAGLFYSRDILDFVAKDLGVNEAERSEQRDGASVEGGVFGYDVYHARRVVEAVRERESEANVAKELGLSVGYRLGSLVFSDGKLMKSARIVQKDGANFVIQGTRGSKDAQITASPISIKRAVDRAKEEGKRQDGLVAMGQAAPSRFAGNKLVTESQYNAARERIKAKLGRLNSGVDPELLTDGMMMAVANIESGVRTFAAFTAEMVSDFGDAIRPYLLSFYEGARNFPGLNDDGMTSPDEARSYHKENNAKPKAVAAAEPKETAQARIAIGRQEGQLDPGDLQDNAIVEDSEGNSYWVRKARHHSVVATPFVPGVRVSSSLDAAVRFNLRPGDTLDIGEKPGPLFTRGKTLDLDAFMPKVAAAAAEAATSPANDKPEPTDAQKKAGNYAKGHVTLHGLGISIENPAGTRRRPEWPALAHHYGYFKGTEGKDGDHVDVFLGPDAENAELPVFVVDQVNKSGRFDEHKVMLGFADEASARAGYLANYTPGWTGLGDITEMSLPDFKSWVSDPARTTKRASASKGAETDAEVPRLTPSEAAELMEWQSLGTKDGVTKHILTFYESKANKDAKRGRMIVATVTNGDRRATDWMVDGDDQAFKSLALAKKRGMQIGMVKAKTDGFVQMSALEQALGADVLIRPVDKAAKLHKEADKLTAEATKMLEGIQPGQPVLSTRDRNLRDRSGEKMRKAVEMRAEADRLDAEKAKSTTPAESKPDQETAPTVAPEQQEAKQASDDRVPEQKPDSKTPNVDAQEAAISALNDGTLTVDQYRAAFESALSSEQAIKEELAGKTKDALLGMLSPMLQSRYRGDKKAAVVNVVYREMVSDYALRGFSYGMSSGSWESAIRNLVESETAETLAAYAEQVKSARAERAKETAAREESIADPKTLDDFRLFIRNARLQDRTYQEAYLMLTPEQRARYDALEAESTREAREERQRKAKTAVRAAGQATDGQIIEAMHTRDHYPLFVVQLSDRLSADDYRTVLAGAKKLGGWYSKFRGNGAVPGFQFKDRAAAEAFVKLAGGDTSAVESAAEQRRDAFDDDRSQSAVERLREMADRLDESADSVLNASRKTNTARRAAFAASALNSAEADKALAKTMRNIASAIESGAAKFLNMVRTKTQVELLRGIVRAAKDNELRAKYSSYTDQEKHKGQPATDETAGFAEFPAYTAFRSDLASLARQMLEVDGLKKLGQQLMTVADDVTDAYIEFAKQPANLYRVSSFAMRRGDDVSAAVFKSKEAAEKAIKRSGLVGKAIVLPVKRGDNRVVMSPSEAINQGIWTGDGDKRITLTPAGGEMLVEAIGRRGNKSNKLSVPWQFQNAYDRRKALSRMGIETPAEFRSALREFIGMQAQATTNKVREMELAMVGRKNDGLDFFPTPEHVADQMIEAAEIQAGMRVLEPSAGMGHIADRIREAGSEPDVIEMAGERRELLEAKGYDLAGDDFMAFESDQPYDRIVMNPPFSNRRDAEHVRHAYSLLKPGGRIVAIMGEGVFFGQDKKAKDFRDWLESVDGTSEKLPPGSFMDPSLPVNTGVSARMVVIDKQDGSDAPLFSRPATEPFYSALSRKAALAPMNTAAPDAWAQYFDALAKRGEVKADEVEWTGLREWLGLQSGKVTKAQVSEYLDANGVQVEETILASNSFETTAEEEARENFENEWPEKWKDWLYDSISVAKEETWRDSNANQWKNLRKTKYQYIKQYTDEDGGTDDDSAREDFDNDFDKLSPIEQLGEEEFNAIKEEAWELSKSGHIEEVENQRDYEKSDDETKYGKYTLPGGSNYREVLLTLPEVKTKKPYDQWLRENFTGNDTKEARDIYAVQQEPAKNYKSSHWTGTPNVLAHIRVNDRTDADGRKVLFVEEMQSDWGQDGKKKGFTGTMEGAKAFYGITDADWNALSQDERQSYVDEMAGRRGGVKGGIPRAPFVDKTDKWLTLALKRVVTMAVDGGYDAVAFVNGDQSADRYDLSKQVKSIDVERYDLPSVGPVADIRVIGLDGRRVHSEDGATMSRIEELVGKEIAERIAAQEPETRKQYAGDGLKVGGEGMRAFYDQIVPNAVKALLKKVGGGAFGSVGIRGESDQDGVRPVLLGNGQWAVQDSDGFDVDELRNRRFPTKVEALNALAAVGQYGVLKQPGFTITDAMREKVAGGLPLFRLGENGAQFATGTDAMRQAVRDVLDSWAGDKPGVEILETADEVPPRYRDKAGHWRTAEGFFAGGKAWVILGNNQNAARAIQTLRHEAVGHYGVERVLGGEWAGLVKGIADVRTGRKGQTSSAEWKSVIRDTAVRYPDLAANDPETFAKEVLAVASERGVPGGLMDRIIAKVRAFLRRFGLVDEGFSEAEARDVLRRAIELVKHGDSAASAVPAMTGALNSSPDRIDAAGKVADAIMSIASSDSESIFRYKKSTAKDLGRVVSDILGDGFPVTMKGALRQNFEQKTQGARSIPVPAEKWTIKTIDGRPVDIYIESDHPGVRPTGRRLFVDAGYAKSGKSLGSGIYAALFQFALNNNMVFVGDPAGLSDTAIFRRTEHMLSAALKHGTTRMMEPHPRQVDPADKNHGTSHTWINPLRWEIGDDAANIASLLETSTSNTMKLLRGTDAHGYVYSLPTGRMLDARGEVVTEQRLDRLASEATAALETNIKAAGGVAAQAVVGHTTVARAISIQSLIRQSQGRSSLLDEVARRLSSAGFDQDALIEAFYSKPAQGTIDVDGVERPRLNSKGQPIHDTDEGIRNFWRWFGDSKVVDDQGRPLVVYHGTAMDFDAFDRKKIGSNYRADKRGFFFADSTSEAYWAASDAAEKNGAVGELLLPVYLHILAPVEIDASRAPGFSASGYYDNRKERILADAKARKADGIIVLGAKPADVIRIVFRPEQIKSAIGNNGEFSANDDRIVFSRPQQGQTVPPSSPAPASIPHQVNATLQGGATASGKIANLVSAESFDRLIYEFQDKFIDLKRIQDRIKEIGGAITELTDAYLGEELFHARLAKRTQNFLRDELKPLLAGLRDAGIQVAELETYLHARHAPEANRVLAERNPNQAMIDQARATAKATVAALEKQLTTAQVQGVSVKAIVDALETAREDLSRWTRAQAFRGTEAERLSLSGMSDADAAAHMSSIEPATLAKMLPLAAQVDAMQAKTLDALVSYGLMDVDSVNAWRSMYQHYIPLHRDEAHPDSVSHPSGSGFNVRGDASRGRTGSNEKVTHILSHIAMQREAALTRGEKNHVIKKLYLMAAQNKDPELWEIDTPPTSRIVDPRTGFVFTQVDGAYKDRPNVVTLRVAGQDRSIIFNEHNPRAVRLAHALKNLDVDKLRLSLVIASKATRWFASVNTQYNPIFGVINLWRDVQSGMLNLSSTELAGAQGEIAKRIAGAMREVYRERRGKKPADARLARLWEEMQLSGGVTGYRDLFRDAGERAKAIDAELKALDRGKASKAAHAVVDWLDHYNVALENAVRLATYDVALSKGMSKAKAASLAKNLTVNFNRKGRQAREIGALYAFFNASVQGTARMMQTLTGPAGMKIVAGGIGVGFFNALIAAAFMGDDYEKIPDFVRERSLVVPMPGGRYLSWQMPLGFHVLPNLGRIAAEMMMGTKSAKDGYVDTLLIAADSFSPLGSASGGFWLMLSPTVSDPLFSLLMNRDWTGMPIYREDMDGLSPTPGHTRAKDSASMPAKVLSEFANWATGGDDYAPGSISPTPDQIDYVVGQVTGGLGREILKAMQVLQSPFNDDELPAHKIPLLGRIYGSTAGQAGESGRFYASITELNVLDNGLRGRQRDGKDVGQFIADNPKARLIPLAKRSLSAVRKLRAEKKRIDAAGGDSSAINDQIADVMASFNEAVAESSE